MKNQKSDPKKVSSKKKLDIDETRKTPKLKPPDKKLNKNWKKSLFIEDEDDFGGDEFLKMISMIILKKMKSIMINFREIYFLKV